MPNASIASEIHQSLDAHRNRAPEVTLDGVAAHLHAQRFELLLAQIDDAGIGGYAGGRAYVEGAPPADAVNRSERDPRVLAVGNVDAGDAGHDLLPHWDESSRGRAALHPCLCLWRPSRQMTLVTPRRLTIRQFLHSRFTDALTLMLCLLC